jgi:RNA polymerase sigma-70 factor (ECF subfamily)
MKNYCLPVSPEENIETEENTISENRESDEIFNLFNEDAPETEEKKALKQCLKKLPVEQRIAVIRFYMEEMSFLDIANSTGYNLMQVKNYIQSGKQNLRNCMKKDS